MSEFNTTIIAQGNSESIPAIICNDYNNSLILAVADTSLFTYEVNKCTIAGITNSFTILAALPVVSTTNTPWQHTLAPPTIIEVSIDKPIIGSISQHGTVELLVYDTSDYAPTIPVSIITITTGGTGVDQPFWS